ncbi:hypothetical protein AG1IA_07755 [Rhizoctonia solani AG-1 IA]|uniref:Uncharacterized protein n=1 Tax=Thanatephorus cucumeris (strain AG1-IA) TaxID=983506 RepID=L8WN45_THACA|nr:hypothetical protein AG1IA_07755 [Rhizoctonia solani AG-1 IA]
MLYTILGYSLIPSDRLIDVLGMDRQVQRERPAYGDGKTGPVESDPVRSWWREVISRTALGAGADPQSK